MDLLLFLEEASGWHDVGLIDAKASIGEIPKCWSFTEQTRYFASRLRKFDSYKLYACVRICIHCGTYSLPETGPSLEYSKALTHFEHGIDAWQSYCIIMLYHFDRWVMKFSGVKNKYSAHASTRARGMHHMVETWEHSSCQARPIWSRMKYAWFFINTYSVNTCHVCNLGTRNPTPWCWTKTLLKYTRKRKRETQNA